MKLEGMVAVITGAATGIGRATAILFASEGAKVVIGDIKEKEGNATVKTIEEAGGVATFVYTDLTVMTEVEKLVKKMEEMTGERFFEEWIEDVPDPQVKSRD